MIRNLGTPARFDDDIDSSAAERRERTAEDPRVEANMRKPLPPDGDRAIEDVIADAEVDGWADATLDRPPSAAIRFCEHLHHYNPTAWGPYVETYLRVYNARRKERAA